MHRQDYHIHTRFSCDSESSLEAVCEAAIAKGLDEIAFTDHLDFGPADDPDYFQPIAYFEAIERCKARYGARLTIRTGIEIGEPHLFGERAEEVLRAGTLDYVLGSAHYDVNMQAGWKESYFEGRSMQEACTAYFEQVAQLAADGDFDVLGHIDLVKRDARKFGRPYDGPEPYADLIRSALQDVIQRGKGIEINTSPLRRGQPEPCPSLEVVRWYRELGGEILTFGSDAHVPEDVGADLDAAREIARSVGFTRMASFEKRELRWHSIA